MKKILSMMAIAALFAGVLSCEVEQEDTFSTDPVAPEFASHGDILMTTNTLDEDVNFSWSAYRNLSAGLTYTLTATYLESSAVLATTDKTYWKTTKAEFQQALYSAFPDLPDNDTFSISFTVSVAADGKVYSSESITVNIYAAGDAIAPVITVVADEIVLDPADPNGELTILEWEPARLVYGEQVTYDVAMTVENKPAEAVATKADGDDAGEEESVEDEKFYVATDLTATSLVLTVDELNEAVISAGGDEAAAVDVTFYVIAKCTSLPNGVSVTSNVVEVETYVATFPEVLYIPGSYQGWDPASAPTMTQSTARKGFYEAVIDLTTADGSDVQFKFSPNPEWKDDFGGSVEVGTFAEVYSYANGTVGVPDNIVVPSGVYNIALDKKFGTIYMVQLETLSMIGSAVGDFGWGTDVDMVYNPEDKTFTVAETELKAGEFKFRFNHNWDHSMGGSLSEVSSTTGDNIASDKEGTYKVILDVSAAPYKVKFVNTSFPEKLYVPGSHNGWGWTDVIGGDGEGKYEGFLNVGGEWGFKLTPEEGWDGGQWGFDTTTQPVENEDGSVTYALTDTDAGNIAEASEVTYARVTVDLSALTATVSAPVTTVGIIGGFTDNSWASDKYPMEYRADKGFWLAQEVELIKGTEWKFRMNGDWAINLGGDIENLSQDGPNIVEANGGIYDIELHISSLPYYAVITKTGESDYIDFTEGPWSVIGKIGTTDWDTDFDMEKDGTTFVAKNIAMNAGDAFKIRFDHAWSFNRGVDAEADGPVTVAIGEEFAVANNGKDISVANAGTYDIYYYSNKETMKIVEAGTAVGEQWSLIGTLGGTNWDTDFDMTFDGTNYVATDVQILKKEQFKIRKDHAWSENRGGTSEEEPEVLENGVATAVVANGKNFAVSDNGKFTVTYNPSAETILVERTGDPVVDVWSLIGQIGDSSWNEDFDLAKNDGKWEIKGIELAAGKEFKLRYSYSWAVNRGLSEAGTVTPGTAGALVQDGGNMSVAEGGVYDLVYDPAAETVLITAASENPDTAKIFVEYMGNL